MASASRLNADFAWQKILNEHAAPPYSEAPVAHGSIGIEAAGLPASSPRFSVPELNLSAPRVSLRRFFICAYVGI
jgi:hypothetical protein